MLLDAIKIQNGDKITAESVSKNLRGKYLSVRDMFGEKPHRTLFGDSKLVDANFAFYTSQLSKVDPTLYPPLTSTTYLQDIPIKVTNAGFFDSVRYYSIDLASLGQTANAVMGNNGNIVPRINVGMNANDARVFTWQVAYDLRFVELEKATQADLKESIVSAYNKGAVITYDKFKQQTLYWGLENGSKGLFNNPNVMSHIIPNRVASGETQHNGFIGQDDSTYLSFINGVLLEILEETDFNYDMLPDTFLVPKSFYSDIAMRMNTLMTSTLLDFLKEHNAGISHLDGYKIRIQFRNGLEEAGVNGKGRVVAYRKDENFVYAEETYSLKPYITLPNMERGAYTTLFVAQISELITPYNIKAGEFGPISYWDFQYGEGDVPEGD